MAVVNLQVHCVFMSFSYTPSGYGIRFILLSYNQSCIYGGASCDLRPPDIVSYRSMYNNVYTVMNTCVYSYDCVCLNENSG